MTRVLVGVWMSIVALVVGAQIARAQGVTADPNGERKQDLVTAYKILVNEGILDSFGHVSVRSAKDPNIFLMPWAMPPSLVSLDDIVELRVSDSQPIDPKGRRVNGERYFHGEIYKARPDVMSVIHSHSQAVIPLSLTPIKLKPVIVQAGFLPPETPTFEIRDAIHDGDHGMQVTDSNTGRCSCPRFVVAPGRTHAWPRKCSSRNVDQTGGRICCLRGHQRPDADAGAAVVPRHRHDEAV